MSTIKHSTDDKAGDPTYAETTNGISGRLAVIMAATGFVLMAVSGFLFFAAAGYSARVNSDAGALLAVGGSGADVIRWASLVDMFGYLLVAPLVAYLRQRFSRDPYIELYTAAGFAYILIGAIGAVSFVAAGPPLMHAYTSASGAQRASIVTTFTTLYQIVVVGLWQTLEGLPGGIWLLGTGIALYRANRRVRSVVAFALGGLLLLIATSRILGF